MLLSVGWAPDVISVTDRMGEEQYDSGTLYALVLFYNAIE